LRRCFLSSNTWPAQPYGAILLDGEPLPNFQFESYHRKIGVVSQDTFLFSNTVKFNIAFSAIATPSDEQIIAAAKKAGAHEFIMELPNSYDTFVGDRGVKLSGGQRQRISIARAILRDKVSSMLASACFIALSLKLGKEAVIEMFLLARGDGLVCYLPDSYFSFYARKCRNGPSARQVDELRLELAP
jgi:ABC-type polar amino acid transport system ATPase subunit